MARVNFNFPPLKSVPEAFAHGYVYAIQTGSRRFGDLDCLGVGHVGIP
jgi:hypothetical protein